MSNQHTRVVVTGRGALCGLGGDVPTIWRNLLAGESALAMINEFDVTDFPTTFAAQLRSFVPPLEGVDRYAQFALAAAKEAVAEARLELDGIQERVAVFLGTAYGGIGSWATEAEIFLRSGQTKSRPNPDRLFDPSVASSLVAREVGARGPVLTFGSAFAGAANAIGEGMRAIQMGRADVVIAGGAEAPITPISMASFAAMGAMSRRNDDPAQAVRPFDLERDGCALGEGAGMLVLERLDHAQARGARILAELVGYGSTAEAFHDVQLEPSGDGLVRAMRLAVDEAGVGLDGIDYINAHGTGTEMNDRVETLAIRTVFGSAAEAIPISSTKAQTGHLLGATGGLEAVISLCALEDGVLPATMNLTAPDPACDLDYVPGKPRRRAISTVLSNSMGFGGHCVALVFARFD